MKKISCNVQSLLSASNQINNHNRAVEELVYNALDARATSIAIRINVQENAIQVIDNGCGLSRKDFNSIGHKHMTSKFIDLSTLKSATNKYGFRGQALANIINVSKSVKVISRHENLDETVMKLFEYGIEKLISKCTARPCKGTTLEITGFLYNLNTLHKSKDVLGTLQSIKTFLEHLSLIHCNISLSLRDDSSNEIIFKMHKNRDIYQTLSTLYNMDNNYLKELQLEKSKYKVTAYLGKSDEYKKHFIFLNGKFISNTSKLHKIVNNNLSKNIKLRGNQKSKMKSMNTEKESNWIPTSIPDYFIFIKCPCMDYDLNLSSKQSVLEFKDWNQIIKLLEKLVKFFNGDINLKEGNEGHNNQTCDKAEYSDKREQVKKIMEKILGTNSKKLGMSHLHNTIKGKQAKRKSRKSRKLSLKPTSGENHQIKNIDASSKSTNDKDYINKTNFSNRTKEGNTKKTPVVNHGSKLNITKSCGDTNIGKTYNLQFKKMSKNNELVVPQKKYVDEKISKAGTDKDVLHRKFEMNTGSIKKRCDQLERRTSEIMDEIIKKYGNMYVNENNVMTNNNPKRHINTSVRRQIDEITIHNNAPNGPKCKLISEYNIRKSRKYVQSNYDLLQTIINSQQENSVQIRNAGESKNTVTRMIPPSIARVSSTDANKTINMEANNCSAEPVITIDSHNYYTHQSYNKEERYLSHVEIQNRKQFSTNNRPRTFITRQSRDNFVIPNDHLRSNKFKKKNQRTRFSKQLQSHIKRCFKQTSKLFYMKKQIMRNIGESSCTIEFTGSYDKDATMTDAPKNARISIEETSPHVGIHHIANNTYGSNVSKNLYTLNYAESCGFHGTYTIKNQSEAMNNSKSLNEYYGINDISQNNKNFIFVSESQEHDQNEQIIDPIDVCETIFHSVEMLDREFRQSFNDKQNNLSSKINYSNSQTKYNNSFCHFYSKLNEKGPEEDNDKNICAQYDMNEVSRHFIPSKNVSNKVINEMETMNLSPNFTLTRGTNIGKQLLPDKNFTKIVNELSTKDFHFMNRLCFLPKGMSPIFQNCQTKYVCNFNFTRDYYEKEIYNSFAVGVRNDAGIFEPKIQDAKETTTKTTDKSNARTNKYSSELKFDGQSLKDSKFLGQIDKKFIAATMKEGCNVASTDYLVLFDQHAVHERIRLEHNLTDYFNGNQWKSVKIDEVSLMLKKDEALYLHNFKDKFEQLGLRWTATSTNKVTIGAIPEAILGKNPRQVEKVIKTVKNLIAEEINIIKIQGGCVSLHPKSIMDLVFSEACRYAIKFGDMLSNSECVELLKTLSDCKTPFQCAHGRPVMAVIMETTLNRVNYKINYDKVMEWKRRL